MKVEAVCTNDGCPTVRENGQKFMQLLDAERINPMLGAALDFDGNVVECPWCGCVVLVMKHGADDAQFALGDIEVSSPAKNVLSWDSHSTESLMVWAAPAQKLVQRHVRGDHGSVTAEVLVENRKWIDANALEADGYIISMYMVKNAPLMIMTNRTRTKTRICLPDEIRLDS